MTKACFNVSPPPAKYAEMWDADKLLQYLETLHPNSELSIYDLGMKAVSLLTVLSLSRQSSLAALGPSFQCIDNQVKIPLVGLEKTSRPTNVRSEIQLPDGENYPPLCLSLCLQEYLTRTASRREYFLNAEGFRHSCHKKWQMFWF